MRNRVGHANPSRPLVLLWGVGGIGGTERRMVETAGFWARDGWQVHHVLIGGSASDPLPTLIAGGHFGTLHYCDSRRVLSILRALKPRLLITFGLRQSAIGRLHACVGSGAIVVVPRNGLDLHWSKWTHALDRLSSGPVSLYLTNSNQVRSHLQSRGYPLRKLATLESGLPDHWYRDVSFGPRPPAVIMVGNSRVEKNHQLGLRAFAESGIPAVLRLYTDNGTEARMLWSALDVAPDQQLEIIEGVVVQPRDYDASAVLLQPSLSESMPRALLEARSRGCRAVVSDVGAMREVVNSDSCLSMLEVSPWAQALTREFRLAIQGKATPPSQFGMTAQDYADAFLRLSGVSRA